MKWPAYAAALLAVALCADTASAFGRRRPKGRTTCPPVVVDRCGPAPHQAVHAGGVPCAQAACNVVAKITAFDGQPNPGTYRSGQSVTITIQTGHIGYEHTLEMRPTNPPSGPVMAQLFLVSASPHNEPVAMPRVRQRTVYKMILSAHGEVHHEVFNLVVVP
ncbi:MAG: hypothetical protein K2X82_26730 [Gemmataceae bacterium]|nr:hypothetical protein [Gemmataceae bacterium]